jgi:hypothetical protein
MSGFFSGSEMIRKIEIRTFSIQQKYGRKEPFFIWSFMTSLNKSFLLKNIYIKINNTKPTPSFVLLINKTTFILQIPLIYFIFKLKFAMQKSTFI